jgi:hypothetical protein
MRSRRPDAAHRRGTAEACGLAVQPVNAAQARNLPGRPKTDKLDTMWLARLTEMRLRRARCAPGPGEGAGDPQRAQVVGGVIARSLGYTSEYAFNRAFTRDRHIPPGRYRVRSRVIRPHDLAEAAEGNRS